jgi:LytS/YehU family sensor histidine kinase
VLDVNRDILDEVPLGDEWAFVRNYVELEQLRLGDRLRIVDGLDPDSLDCLIPAFTLQPLVENAVRHGIATQPQGGTLTVTSRLVGNDLVLEVKDDGAGADPEAVRRANGVGMRAVRQRLEARYGANARLAINTAPGGGFTVTVSLPARAVTQAPAAPAIAAHVS